MSFCILQLERSNPKDVELMKNSKLIASLYHAYAIVIDAFLDNLVSFYQPSTEIIFNVCSYLVNSIEIGKVPKGISIVRVLNELAKSARILGAFQTATNVFHRVQEEYIIPQDLRNEFRLQAMTIQVRGRGFWFYHYDDSTIFRTKILSPFRC